MSREIFHRFSKLNNSVCQNMSCSITGIPLLISERSLFPLLLLATLILSYIEEQTYLLMREDEETDFCPHVTSHEGAQSLLRLVSISGSSVLVSIAEMSPLKRGVCVKILQCLREEGENHKVSSVNHVPSKND